MNFPVFESEFIILLISVGFKSVSFFITKIKYFGMKPGQLINNNSNPSIKSQNVKL